MKKNLIPIQEKQKQDKGTAGDKREENIIKSKQKKVKRRTPQPNTSPAADYSDSPNRPPSVHSTKSVCSPLIPFHL